MCEVRNLKRRYLSRLIVDSIPASYSLEYVKDCFLDYLDRHQDFKVYLNSIKEKLKDKYHEFDGLFELSFKSTSMVLGKHSILNTFVKLYNYHFDVSMTLEYLCRCRIRYRKMLIGSFELKEMIFNENGFVDYYFQVVKTSNEELIDYYPYELFLSTNGIDDGITKISFNSEHELYEDSWYLFGVNDYQIINKIKDVIYNNDLNGVIKYSKDIYRLINSNEKLSISSIQRYLGIGFSKSNKIYQIIKTYVKGD